MPISCFACRPCRLRSHPHSMWRRVRRHGAAFALPLLAACGELPTPPLPGLARVDRLSSIQPMPIHELAPGIPGWATGINEDGTIAGFVGNSPFLWRDGVLTRLPLPPGVVEAEAWAINEQGHLALRGWFSGSPYRTVRSYLWTAEQGYTDIGTLGGRNALVWGMNDLDQIVGYSDGLSGARAYVWTPGSPMLEIVPAGGFSEGKDINNAGDILIGGSGGRLRRGDDGRIVFLRYALAVHDVNEHGQSAGLGATESGWHAFIWDRDGNPTDLTPDLTSGFARASVINDHGIVAGSLDNFHPVVWVRGKMYPLATLGASAHPWAISNSGRIVGIALRPNGGAGYPVYWDVIRTADMVLGDMQAAIEQMVATGAVAAGPSRPLLQLVSRAATALEDERPVTTATHLRTFVTVVNALEGSGQMPSGDAALLRALAAEALELLQM